MKRRSSRRKADLAPASGLGAVSASDAESRPQLPAEPRAGDRPLPRSRPWYRAFLTALRDSCNIRASCEAAGVHRSTAYEARQRDPAFADAWQEALDDAVEALEAHARAMAFAGDTTMTIFLLKAHRPAVYRDRYEVDVRQQQLVKFVPAMGGVHASED